MCPPHTPSSEAAATQTPPLEESPPVHLPLPHWLLGAMKEAAALTDADFERYGPKNEDHFQGDIVGTIPSHLRPWLVLARKKQDEVLALYERYQTRGDVSPEETRLLAQAEAYSNFLNALYETSLFIEIPEMIDVEVAGLDDQWNYRLPTDGYDVTEADIDDDGFDEAELVRSPTTTPLWRSGELTPAQYQGILKSFKAGSKMH